ncbi:MAG: ATP-binding protein, partial [Bacillota bacterium]
MEASVRPGALIHFPSADDRGAQASARVVPFSPAARLAADSQPVAELSIRVAVYPTSQTALPAVYDLSASDPGALLADACSRAAHLVREQGSPIPAEAVVAVVENLIHARFHLAAVSITADGAVTVSDQGPGIPDKERAVLPGFTTATAEMRRYIRGIGSGLTIARQLMDRLGGSLSIEDNLAGGTVVTLHPPHISNPLTAARPPPPTPSPA